jgi:hypothetical protein
MYLILVLLGLWLTQGSGAELVSARDSEAAAAMHTEVARLKRLTKFEISSALSWWSDTRVTCSHTYTYSSWLSPYQLVGPARASGRQFAASTAVGWF